MEINKEYKQIFTSAFSGYKTNYDALKGKVVDKVGFTNRNSYDTQIFIITFTDKTFIALGVGRSDSNFYEDEPRLEDSWVLPPQNVNNGDFRVHSWVDSENNIHFEDWINILRGVGIWKFSDDDARKIMEKHKKESEDREYQTYLHLKQKFEGIKTEKHDQSS